MFYISVYNKAILNSVQQKVKVMTKFFYFAAASFFILSIKPSFAEESANLRGLLISDEIIVEEKADKAKSEAGKILDSKPKKLDIKGLKLEPIKRRGSIEKEEPMEEAPPPTPEVIDKYGQAPFGLVWGTTNSYTKNSGVILEDISANLTPRTYYATYLPKPVADFDKVSLYFGRDNKLWRIIAYGTSFEDNAQGNVVMREYNKYSRLLEKKYGNKKETFTPKITKVEKIKEISRTETETVVEIIKSEIGNDNFLNEIKNEESTLFTTFTDGKIAVALSVAVDENNKGYIIIDYKNLELIKEQEDAAFDSI